MVTVRLVYKGTDWETDLRLGGASLTHARDPTYTAQYHGPAKRGIIGGVSLSEGRRELGEGEV